MLELPLERAGASEMKEPFYKPRNKGHIGVVGSGQIKQEDCYISDINKNH